MAREMPKKMMACISDLARGPIRPSAIAPIDRPLARTEMTRAPKSCTQPIRIAPKTTQIIAGSQPQTTAIAGPSIGDRPVIDA